MPNVSAVSDSRWRSITLCGTAAIAAIGVSKKHLGRVAALSCIVCRNEGLGPTPANAHHINAKTMGRKSSDFETIPLCPVHHQYGDGSARYQGQIAVHRSLREFEARYGTEAELLAQTLRELED